MLNSYNQLSCKQKDEQISQGAQESLKGNFVVKEIGGNLFDKTPYAFFNGENVHIGGTLTYAGAHNKEMVAFGAYTKGKLCSTEYIMVYKNGMKRPEQVLCLPWNEGAVNEIKISEDGGFIIDYIKSGKEKKMVVNRARLEKLVEESR